MVPTLTDAESKIVDEMGDTAAFAGIPSGGVESPIGGTPPAAAHPITGTALAKSIETVRAVAALETPSATLSVDGETEQQLEDGAPPLKTRKLSLKHAAPTSSSTDYVRSLQIQVLEAQLATQKKIGETCDVLMSVATKFGDIADRINQFGMIERLSGYQVVHEELLNEGKEEEEPKGDFSNDSDFEI
jgi:hypothetical protein